jgi:hypothetical protein
MEILAHHSQPIFATSQLTQQQVNAEIIETFQASADWGGKVMLGGAALLFLAGFLAFLLWRAAD